MLPEFSEAQALLAQAREARAVGDGNACLVRCVVAYDAARADGDVDTAFWSLLCAGNFHLSRAEPHDALRWFSAAVDEARGNHASELLPLALHDLFLAQAEAGMHDDARKTALAAFEAYQDAIPSHPHVAGLVADFTLPDLWYGEHAPEVEKKQAERGLRLYHTALYCTPELKAKLQMYCLANIIHAAGILKLESRYNRTWIELQHVVLTLPNTEGVAASYIQAGEGARRFERFEQAHGAAKTALQVAQSRGESILAERAAVLLDLAARCSTVPLPMFV